MAFSVIPEISIRGIAACVPTQRSHNAESPLLPGAERQQFIAGTGIEERRVAPENICSSDLCAAAAEKLLAQLNWEKSEINFLVFVSQTRDYILPATACLLQHRLGLPESCATFDVPLGCSGWVYGLNTLSAILRTTCGKGLLLAGDTATRLHYSRDKTSFPLFGDAGSATALEFTLAENTNKRAMKFNLGSDGSGADTLIIPDGGYRSPCSPKSFNEYVDPQLGATLTPRHARMNGMDVFAFAQSQVPQSVRTLCDKCGIELSAIDLFVFHQANKAINERIRTKLGLPEEKVPSSLKNFGNTSSASIPLTLVTQAREILSANEEHQVLACGFGVGLSWATALFHTQGLVIPKLIELS
ncbi:MAG: ketoacyl-ACP synthase III [Bacteroidales bacterium]|nr:ketoacyl-ACP synthase III [Bacteroidales bacterium]